MAESQRSRWLVFGMYPAGLVLLTLFFVYIRFPYDLLAERVPAATLRQNLDEMSAHIGQIVSKEDLCQAGLGRPLTKFDRSVDVHVSNLRKKLVSAGADNDIIVNQRGSGYLLKADKD